MDREYLSGSISLSRNEDGSLPEKYEIKEVIGEGGSTICYEAIRTRADGIVESGKLKEYYPIDAIAGNKAWYYSLVRLDNGQLVPGTGTVRKFDEMCKDYLNNYKLLRQVMLDNPKNEILKSYIQQGEVLYGCTLNEDSSAISPQNDNIKYRRPTVYIWSPGVAGVGFDEYLRKEVRSNPYEKSEKKLRDILSVVFWLVDCIKALHTAGLIHMDIKPSNFLVEYDSDFDIKPNNISLFDINTLSSIESEFLKPYGTEGYCAPEVKKGEVDNRSDIYSIGAMLFNAVVISKEISNGLYRDEFYDKISQFVKNSELFRYSAINSDVTLMALICKILEKCLAKNPRARYQSCSELKSDLNRARHRLDKMLWTQVKNKDKVVAEPDAVIQQLLYEHPLYETHDINSKSINVQVIGAGSSYREKFIDTCLYVGQMSGIKLNIDVFSDEPEEDRNNYLRFRPAISEFVNVNGSLKGKEQLAYANLDFRGICENDNLSEVPIYFTNKRSQVNSEIVKMLVSNSRESGKKYDYVFVALGSDILNSSIAKLLKDEMGDICPVCYISKRSVKASKENIRNRLYAVCIGKGIDIEKSDNDLGEIAFNTHIIWKDSLNIDVINERKKFFKGKSQEDRYNRTSSMAFALSIKYKLYSLHFDCSDLDEVADLFSKKILDLRETSDEAKKQYDCMVDLEHRRWLIEHATEGWAAPRNDRGKLLLNECVIRGSVKDSINKLHPCMVRGSETSPLNEYNRELWDEGELDSSLDELDRMSIELHRCFKLYADRIKEESIWQNPDILFIDKLISTDCDEVRRAFKQYVFVLKNILDGVESYSKQYRHFQSIFQNSLEQLDEDIRLKIEGRLSNIANTFFVVIESNLYRNYKAYDEILIRKLPYILSYRYVPTIAMPFVDGKNSIKCNEANFENVAAASVLSPLKIKYLYYYNKDSNYVSLIQKLEAVNEYLRQRSINCGIEFVVACDIEIPDHERDRIQNELELLREKHKKWKDNNWFEEAIIYDVHNKQEAIEKFVICLKESFSCLYNEGPKLFISEQDDNLFIKQIDELGIAHFAFDWKKKHFLNNKGCKYLQYVEDNSFIRVRDIFALMNTSNKKFNHPEMIDDYEILWNIYTGKYLVEKQYEDGVFNWNYLCNCLKEYEANQKPLARFVINRDNLLFYKKLFYYIPVFCLPTVKKILNNFVELGIADSSSRVITQASDTCKLLLLTKDEYEDELNKVFSNPQILLPYYGVEVIKSNKGKVEFVDIKYNNLVVNDLNMNLEETGNQDRAWVVLKQLEKERYILNLQQDMFNPGNVSFVYSSPRIKKLLTGKGGILEVYTYYEALRTGYFDDIICGYELDQDKGTDEIYMNLILTKGFKSIFVKIPMGNELNSEYLKTFDKNVNQYGIESIKVLLNESGSYICNEKSDQHEELKRIGQNIKVVSGSDEVMNIGCTLIKLVEDNL